MFKNFMRKKGAWVIKWPTHTTQQKKNNCAQDTSAPSAH